MAAVPGSVYCETQALQRTGVRYTEDIPTYIPNMINLSRQINSRFHFGTFKLNTKNSFVIKK